MKKQIIGKIVFSKVLQMPLVKYLTYIEKTTKGPIKSFSTLEFDNNKSIYARIMVNEASLYFDVLDKRLETIYSTENCTGNKIICSLKWINTRNRFSSHILKSLLDYQSKYWFSGKEADLKPLTLKQFLSIYSLQYLDQTRLSRLTSNLLVISPKDKIITLKNLFVSNKKYHSYLIKEIVYNNENPLKDKDIQYLLEEKGAHLSLRTICNCRKLASIPNYKEKADYYAKDITFSDYIMLLKKYFYKIPGEGGVYELSISSKKDYSNHRSNIIYIGRSKNLRKRIANYSGNKLRNEVLKGIINNHDVFVRFF